MKCGEMLTKTSINDCHVVIKHMSVFKKRKSNHEPCKSVKIVSIHFNALFGKCLDSNTIKGRRVRVRYRV